jgi:hypothetical protein
MKRTTLLAGLFIASFAAFAVVEALLPAGALSASGLVHGVIIGVICYLWCRAESRARFENTPGRSALYAGVLPLIGVPIYFFRTRKAGPAFMATGKALLLLLAAIILSVGISSFLESVRA